jgi:hypothetical protein
MEISMCVGNTITASTHDMAKPQKLRADMHKPKDWNNVNFHSHRCRLVLCHTAAVQICWQVERSAADMNHRQRGKLARYRTTTRLESFQISTPELSVTNIPKVQAMLFLQITNRCTF